VTLAHADVRAWVPARPGTREVFVGRWNEHTLRYREKISVVCASAQREPS